MNIERLSAPAMVTWQLTRDCDLACLHCCTDSAPGRALPNELDAVEAVQAAKEFAEAGIPKVMLCGGEPTIVPHFFDVAETLGHAGVFLKVETNGQGFTPEHAARLAKLPMFSVQISLDGDTQQTYGRQRPGGSLEKAHAACRAVVAAGLPLEVTFAPTRVNIHEAGAVVERAAALGAFRFNTGMLMRLGTASKLWDRLEPSRQEYAKFLRMLRRRSREFRSRMELCFTPWRIEGEIKVQLQHPPATVLMLPDGKWKVSAALPYLCADLRKQTLAEAWDAYRAAWTSDVVSRAVERAAEETSLLSKANAWTQISAPVAVVGR
ncbi:MAG: radical SAM protein [Elusimicrobia bacterium]|nr:radical SAM protein [Elusimicrobiota bacterium]